MVEGISGSSSGSGPLSVDFIEERKVEEILEEESAPYISSKDLLKKFLVEGGDQAKYQKVLEVFYGKELIQRIFPKNWTGPLTGHHCYEILERIGQGVTLQDLERFYAEYRSGQIQSEILKDTLPSYFRLWLWTIQSVQGLPPFWFAHFLDLFQNPIKTLELVESKERISYKDPGAVIYPHYVKQVDHLVRNGDRFRPEFFYASKELLAKWVAYVNPNTIQDGVIIPVFNQEIGKVVYYTLKGQVHDSGLHAYLFVPIEKGDFPAQLIFRGTNGYASAGRDLDARGVGQRVFQANKERIISLIKKAKTEKIEIIGHSLGAADAQRGMALLVEPGFTFSFKELRLFAFCAPRLEIDQVNQWKANLKALAATNKHPIIRLNFAHHESDVVTWTGDSYLSGVELDFVYSNYLTVRSKSGAMQTPVHHTNSFFKNGKFDFETDGRTFEFRQGFPNKDLEVELSKLKQIQNASQFWRQLQSYFIELEKEEDIKDRVKRMREHQTDISRMEKGESQHSWLVYKGLNAARYTVQPIFYYAFEGILTLVYYTSKGIRELYKMRRGMKGFLLV